MPLNEHLERRRRENIAEYQRTLCCHICGSAARNAKGFSHFIDSENNNDEGDGPPELAEMRMCACFQRPNNRNHGSVPLRVCEMCIRDDAGTGRIRCCGLCGIVACDENCVELVECTDNEEWNNEGCLECRGFESFNEIEIFRRRRHTECPRVNRICTECLNLFTLVSLSGFSNYRFKCRYFKCNRLLVQSDIVELKRFLKPFPVSMLPEEMLVDIIDFLGAKDLVSAALTCTTLFKKIEKKSKDLIQSVQHLLPNGPILNEECESGVNGTSTLVYASGRNSQPLSPPEDGKTWLKILERVEKMIKDTYFGFQVKAGDEGCAMRYLRSKDRIAFVQTYTTTALGITPHLASNDLSITGGQVIVKRFRLTEMMLHHREERHAAREGRVSRNIIFSADKTLDAGIHRVVFRYYCHCERGNSIGIVGILSKSETSAEWVGSVNVDMSNDMGVINEEVLIGLEYNSDDNKLRVFTCSVDINMTQKTTKQTAEFDIPEEAENMSFAASLSIGSALFGGNQISIRSCNPREWDLFLSHNHDNNLAYRCRGRRSDLRRRRIRMRARIDGDDSDDETILGLEEQEHFDALIIDDPL